jgi:membrane-bound lytic murein transglycosylase D
MIPVGEGRGDVVVEPRIGDPQPMQIASEDGRVRNIYRVRKGDSLSEIARRYKVSVSSLKSWNHLWGKKYIYPGQSLIVWTKAADSNDGESQLASIGPPAPGSASKAGVEVHIVQPGDTLWDISRLYGVSIKDLMNWNGIRSARRLKPGTALKLQP